MENGTLAAIGPPGTDSTVDAIIRRIANPISGCQVAILLLEASRIARR